MLFRSALSLKVFAVAASLVLLNASLLHSQTAVYYAPMTINNITSWYSSNGGLEIYTGSKNFIPGATFPNNTAGVVYMSGFMYTAQSPQLIAHGAWYNNTLQQGAINGIQTGIADSKYSPAVRIWRIRKDFNSADLRRDASVTFGVSESNISIVDMQRLRAQYKKDWLEWPAEKGAPYYDVNGNGIYDPKFIINSFNVEVPDTATDSPGIANADQVIWYVCNDLGGNSPFGSTPAGMELQMTIWGFKADNALGNTIFRRTRMIYKGTSNTTAGHSLTDMFAGIWSDIDLGLGNDDLAGSDSLLGLGYVYNSRVQDTEFSKFGIVPPSVGYDILQGPVVKGTSLDSAVINFSYRKGFRNLSVSAINFSSSFNTSMSSGAAGAQHLKNALKGLSIRDGVPLVNPTTMLPSAFRGSGDPVTRAGWVDGVYESAGNRELFIGVGPFSMTLGDTQEVVSVFIAAHSPDRLASVNVLKYQDKLVQDAFQNMISIPSSMPMTSATATAFDRKILIEWEKDTASLNRTERYASNGYLFEGYELFQLPSADAPISSWKLIGTYDLKNEVMQVLQDEIDPITGRVEPAVKHQGKNSGVLRYLMITGDSLRALPLINGQQYVYALRSYAVTSNANAIWRSVASEPQILTVVPHQPDPEHILPYAVSDSLTDFAENIVGQNDGRIGIKILDPYSVSGGTFDIWYGKFGSNGTWTVIKNIAGTDYARITAALTASELAPPRPNPLPRTTGTVEFILNDAKDRIAYTITIATTATITSVEFYSGPRNSNGLLAKSIATNSSSVTGVWTMTDASQPLSAKLITDFISGNLYVLVRTVQYPNGEMRGQLVSGMTPRVTLQTADFSTSSRSVFSFPENRLPMEGFSLFVSPAPIGFKSGKQVAPTVGNVINTPNPERTYFLIGPGYAWGANRYHESIIEIRFTSDINWAITSAAIPAETKFIRVPFQVYKDSIRVVPVIENIIASDSVWDIKGNSYQNGLPLFDKIIGIADAFDYAGFNISYDTVFYNGTFTESKSLKGRLINGVNHIAKNITVVNVSGDGRPPSPGTIIQLTPYRTISAGDIKRFVVQPVVKGSVAAAKKKISEINVFPNPYYGVNQFERELENKYVTFSHLPQRAVLKIYNLAGIHVRTMEKNSTEQFFRWDLRNHAGNLVASGIYLVYIDMKEIGVTVIKLAVIMEHQEINSY